MDQPFGENRSSKSGYAHVSTAFHIDQRHRMKAVDHESLVANLHLSIDICDLPKYQFSKVLLQKEPACYVNFILVL